jgi:hypothetical protein
MVTFRHPNDRGFNNFGKSCSGENALKTTCLAGDVPLVARHFCEAEKQGRREVTGYCHSLVFCFVVQLKSCTFYETTQKRFECTIIAQ